MLEIGNFLSNKHSAFNAKKGVNVFIMSTSHKNIFNPRSSSGFARLGEGGFQFRLENKAALKYSSQYAEMQACTRFALSIGG